MSARDEVRDVFGYRNAKYRGYTIEETSGGKYRVNFGGYRYTNYDDLDKAFAAIDKAVSRRGRMNVTVWMVDGLYRISKARITSITPENINLMVAKTYGRLGSPDEKLEQLSHHNVDKLIKPTQANQDLIDKAHRLRRAEQKLYKKRREMMEKVETFTIEELAPTPKEENGDE